MKTLFLVRHAKSGWGDDSLRDFDRPLNKRGLNDAPIMGDILRNLPASPDLIVSSPAKRAISTAEIIAEKLGYPIEKIIPEKSVYEAGPADLLTVVRRFDDVSFRAMLFGHNPGTTILANSLINIEIGDVPTCGVIQIEFSCERWRDISRANSSFIMFDYPKKHK